MPVKPIEFPQSILPCGEELTFLKGTSITQQYAKAEYFFILLEGRVNFYIHIEEKPRPLLVGKSHSPNSPLGWSGLNLPNRYTSTIKVTSKKARALRFRREDMERSLAGSEDGIRFYKWLNSQARNLIKETADFLSDSNFFPGHLLPKAPELLPLETTEAFQTLRKSPFFEIFEERFLKGISAIARKALFLPGQVIYRQQECSEELMLLQEGHVDFFFEDKSGKVNPLRAVSQSGYVVGWSGLLEETNIVSAVARTPTEVLIFGKDEVSRLLAEENALAIRFHKRILWLITHQLQSMRARLVMKKYDQEWLSIQSLIEQNANRIRLDSPLHKLPLLLKSPLTLKNAFDMLEDTRENGDTQERYIANSCSDILRETRREQSFYQALIEVYEGVRNHPADSPTLAIRRACAQKVESAFNHTHYEIEGWENLPATSGHIFIYNHLKNHDYNTLPNKFQITLDSHFISAMVLSKKYEDPGLRIVRIGRGSEYGHQDYYEKLGHINVFTPESDSTSLTKEQKALVRKSFFDGAARELSAGRNLIISPEGTSFHTEDSPGPFKPGAFNLALNLEQEPYIVPICMLNFDRRVRYNTFRCSIQKPFKVSDYLSPNHTKDEMSDFLVKCQDWFRNYISESHANRESASARFALA